MAIPQSAKTALQKKAKSSGISYGYKLIQTIKNWFCESLM